VDEVCERVADILEELCDLSRGLHRAIPVEAGLGQAAPGAGPALTAPGRRADAGDGRLSGYCEATAYYVVAEAFINAAKDSEVSWWACVRGWARTLFGGDLADCRSP
jgi:hypothetical protein